MFLLFTVAFVFGIESNIIIFLKANGKDTKREGGYKLKLSQTKRTRKKNKQKEQETSGNYPNFLLGYYEQIFLFFFALDTISLNSSSLAAK
jgi:hypothetical protein